MAKILENMWKSPASMSRAKSGNLNQFQSPARRVPINYSDKYIKGIQIAPLLESIEILSQIAQLTQTAIPHLMKHGINIAG